jgi:hypothetical protein
MEIDGTPPAPADSIQDRPPDHGPADGGGVEAEGGCAKGTKMIDLEDCITYLESDTELGRTPLLYKTYSLLTQ